MNVWAGVCVRVCVYMRFDEHEAAGQDTSDIFLSAILRVDLIEAMLFLVEQGG